MIAEINSEEGKRPVMGTCLWSAWDEMRMIYDFKDNRDSNL